MDRQGKEKLRVAFAEIFNGADAAIIAEYRGLTVEEMTELRRSLRAVKGRFRVLKNRVAKKALIDEAKDSGALSGHLKGPVGVAYFTGDPAQAAKSVLKFADEHAHFIVRGAIVGASVMSNVELKALSDLPSREVLLARVVGSLISPHRGLLMTFNGVSRNLVQVIDAIKDKKQG